MTYEMNVTYLGKTYTFSGDSIALVDTLERQFGSIIQRSYDRKSHHCVYITKRGAVGTILV